MDESLAVGSKDLLGMDGLPISPDVLTAALPAPVVIVEPAEQAEVVALGHALAGLVPVGDLAPVGHPRFERVGHRRVLLHSSLK